MFELKQQETLLWSHKLCLYTELNCFNKVQSIFIFCYVANIEHVNLYNKLFKYKAAH